MIIKSANLVDLSESDLEIIKDLDRKHFPFPWSDSSWKSSRTIKEYVAFIDPNGVGFALFLLSPLEQLAHLIKIVVVAKSRRNGLASSILNASHSQFRMMGMVRCILEVDVSNSAAITLYEKHGYNKIHYQKKFYSNGADAHIMEKHL